MSVVCQYSKSTGARVPVLSWATTNTQVVDLSIDNPGVVGSYGGGYPPSGQLELPPNGCDPAQGTQTYTLYAISNTGPMAQRTINWVPPVAATTAAVTRTTPPTATTAATTTSSSPPPIR